MSLRAVLVGLAVMSQVALAAGADEPVRYDGHALVYVEVRSEADLARLQAISPDLWTDYPGVRPLVARIPPDRMDDLVASGLTFKVLAPDLQRLIDAEQTGPFRTDWDHYMPYTEMLTWMNARAAAYPALCEVISLGNSVQFQPIKALHITGAEPDPKPAVLYHGLIHAREWITGPQVLYLANYLLTNYGTDPCVTDLVDRLHFYLAPCVNPDGYSYSWSSDRQWRKNRRNNGDGSYGVDLNRNWAYGWGGGGSSGIPSDPLYRGPSPFSEPETTAVSNFIIAHPNIRAYMDFHSYSQLLMWPYGYANVLPPEPDQTTFETVGETMADLILAVHGEPYETGPIYSTIYQASGGSVDWVYGAQDRFGFTIELRPGPYEYPGFELPPTEIVPVCEEMLPALLHLSQFAANDLVFAFPGGLPTTVTAGSPTPIPLTISPVFAAVDPNTASVHYRTGPAGEFHELPLAPTVGDGYLANLPAFNCTHQPEFYFTATSLSGQTVRSPACDGAYAAGVLASTAFFYEQPLSANPNWTTQGQWAFGQPTGGGGTHTHDPTAGHTGSYVYGYNLNGDYPNSMTSTQYLTSQAFNCTGRYGVKLEFWRWLGVESNSNYDKAQIEVSNNGMSWTVIWRAADTGGAVEDTAWTFQSLDISSLADNQPLVYIRWGMGPTDGSVTYCGWNIDDIRLASIECPAPPACPGDTNCDGAVGFADIDYFVAAIPNNYTAWENLHLAAAGSLPSCAFGSCDVNGDSNVGFDDIDPFVALIPSTCP